MTDPAPGFALFARAFDTPHLTIRPATGAHRWRGPIPAADTLPVHPDAPHRFARLQVLRRAIDLQPDGRYAVRISRDDDPWLIGPMARDLPPSFDIARCIDTWPYARMLRRVFLRIDGCRVDARIAAAFPGARRDLSLDPPPVARSRFALPDADMFVPDARAALHAAVGIHRDRIATYARRRRRLFALIDPALVPPVTLPGDRTANPSRLIADPREAGAHLALRARDARLPGMAAPRATRAEHDAPDPDAIDPAMIDPREPAPEEPPTLLRRVKTLPAKAAQSARITRHDEWSYRDRSYRRLWVTVHEQRITPRDMHYLADLRARFPALARRIGRGLARMRPDAPRRERRLPDGEVIDIEAAIEALADRRSHGDAGGDRHYVARPRRERDVVVALLLDMSGSTGHRLPPRTPSRSSPADDEEPLWQTRKPHGRAEPPPEPRIIDVARDAVGLLCEAMDALGDRHAVFAFSGQGREHVEFAVVKRFGDAWSATTAAALAAVQPRGYTRTGAAVRHALDHLRGERGRRKVLIVLSDGYPQDDDYGPREDTLEYALQDTAHALREAERAGVATFNISIDAGDTDYLRRMCPRNRYWVVRDVAALPARMQSLYRLMALGTRT